MLRKLWMLFRSPGAWAITLVFGTPWLAEAQQSGLFPLAPIRRERVPCPMEDPIYERYRHQYFGYHATCWRPFPAGWGCPTPEAPDVARAFKERPRSSPPPILPPEEAGPEEPGEMGEEGGAEPEKPATAPDVNLPLPPPRSPFELDTTEPKGASLSPAKPNSRVRTAPTANPDPTNFNPPPLEFGPERPVKPSTGSGLPSAGSELPPVTESPSPLAPTTARPARAMAVPAASMTPSTSTSSGALMPLSDSPVSSSALSNQPPVYGVPAGAMVGDTAPAAIPVSPPVQAPRRTSLLGGLFGGLSRNRR